MFPYASLVLNRADLKSDTQHEPSSRLFLSLQADSTLAEVAKSIDSLLAGYRHEYQDALEANINNVLPNVVSDWSGAPFYVSYSLKFSRTSNSYTIYRFDYYEREATDAGIAVDHIWIDPQSLLSAETENLVIEGKAVAESDPIALKALLAKDGH